MREREGGEEDRKERERGGSVLVSETGKMHQEKASVYQLLFLLS